MTGSVPKTARTRRRNRKDDAGMAIEYPVTITMVNVSQLCTGATKFIEVRLGISCNNIVRLL